MSKSTAITAFANAGAPLQTSDMATALANVRNTVPQAGGLPFLRLIRSGEWVYGQENVEVEEGSEWAVNVNTFQHGWCGWVDSRLEGEAMAPFTQSLPNVNELPELPDDRKGTASHYSKQLAVQLQCLSGEDEGTVVLYKVNSVGGTKALGALLDAVLAQLATDPEKIYPVLVLNVESYKHKEYGQIFTPELDLQRFVSLSGEASTEAKETPKKEKAEKPNRRRRARTS